jgi:2-hydroxychromene-2-carboxylate isomerase
MQIEFYFDFSSPYGYFASFKANELAEGTDATVAWKPFMAAIAFGATGNKPLAEQPIKSDYCIRDWERLGRFMDVPWELPDPFPVATLAAARTFYWLDDNDPVLARHFAQTIFDAYFGLGRDISSEAVVAEIAASLYIDVDDMLAAIRQPAAKERLKQETDAAIEKGVIGSPYFIVDGEGFWGSDRMWMIRRWIKRGGW